MAMMDKLLGSLPDTELMGLARRGDEKGFIELYSRYRVRLIQDIRRLLGRYNENGVAEDLAQTAWANVLKAREQYVPTATFSSYLGTVARHVVFDYLDKKRVEARHIRQGKGVGASPEVGDEAELVPVEEPCSDMSRDLEIALSQLPVKQRHVVELHLKVGLTLAEIAEELQAAKETIRGRWKLAIKKLRKDGEHLRIYCETNPCTTPRRKVSPKPDRGRKPREPQEMRSGSGLYHKTAPLLPCSP